MALALRMQHQVPNYTIYISDASSRGLISALSTGDACTTTCIICGRGLVSATYLQG